MAELVDLPAGRQARKAQMDYFVYLLQCKNGETYKGLTSNIEKRLNEHQKGRVVFTKDKRPFRLVHVEICVNRKKARDLEKFFKSGFGREVIKDLIIN